MYVPNLVMIGSAVWPPILDRHTHTQNLYYIDIDIWVFVGKSVILAFQNL